MNNLDSLDRKLLYELSIDSRQPLAYIGRKIGIPKSVVDYRLNRLIEKGIVKQFNVYVDHNKLGYRQIKIFYKYQYINPQKQMEIIDYFIGKEYCNLVASTEGQFDLLVGLLLTDNNHICNFWEETQEKFGHFFRNKELTIFIKDFRFTQSYIFKDKNVPHDYLGKNIPSGNTLIDVDQLDINLLRTLMRNARTPLNKLTKLYSTSTPTISKRLKKLTRNGLIRAFTVDIDVKKIGYQIFKSYVLLKDVKKRKNIIEYAKLYPNLVSIEIYAGKSDIDLEFHCKNSSDFHRIMQDIIRQFPDSIRSYLQIIIIDYHKSNYIP
ncbi:MAG: Lrp/AsnC family transcriptional regulator [Candidatus Thermoplasmatota archaeon]|nr:Lrp/AsnC family transcriptional regulator [Candidatus Thermoplasmatota archaeon]